VGGVLRVWGWGTREVLGGRGGRPEKWDGVARVVLGDHGGGLESVGLGDQGGSEGPEQRPWEWRVNQGDSP
jgi:hypothetical protein